MPAPMLTFAPEHRALRTRLREWLTHNDSPPPPADFDARIAALADWQRRLHAAGFVGLSWPAEHGGADLGIAAEAVLAEELAGTGMPELVNRIALYTVGPAIQRWGTPSRQGGSFPACWTRASCGARASPSPAQAPTSPRSAPGRSASATNWW